MKLLPILLTAILSAPTSAWFAIKMVPQQNKLLSGPWPADPKTHLVAIPYCYENEDAREKLHDLVEDAKAIWWEALQTPSKGAGHTFKGFEEQMSKSDSSKPALCMPDGYNWNDDVIERAVAITVCPNTYYSTIGCDKYAWGGQHLLCIAPGKAEDALISVDKVEVAHELGHVLGLGHEHQRPDRDDHVQYNCLALDDWEIVRKKTPKSVDDETLCTDWKTADTAGFSAKEYCFNGDYADSCDSGPEYDVQSIMHYPSLGHWNKKGSGNPIDYPLSHRQTPDADQKHLEFINRNEKVSAGDAAGIRHLYGWPITDAEMDVAEAGSNAWIEYGVIPSSALTATTLDTVPVSAASATESG